MTNHRPWRPRFGLFYPFAAVVGTAMVLSGCDGSIPVADGALQYADRVESELGTATGEPAKAVPFPRRRDRLHVIEPVRVSLGQWSDLEDCEAGALIAQANSPLGKVRSAFERVRHSHALIAALDDCQRTMTEEEWAEFEPDRAKKAEQVDEERWNAFWVSDAVERSVGRTTPLDASLKSGAFEQWRQLVAAITPGDRRTVDDAQWYGAEATLDKSAGVGEAFRFMLATTAGLERVAQAVEQTRTERSVCMRKDRRVIAVMRGEYAKKLQPLMARGDVTLRNASQAMADALTGLEPSAGVPAAMQPWAAQWSGNRAFEAYRAATRRHATAIGKLLTACNETL